MRNRDEVLHQFGLWGERFRIHDHQFSLMRLTDMLEQGEPKADQSILMSNDHPLDFSCQNGIHQLEKALALEIETSANFHDPLIHHDLLVLSVTLQCRPLIVQIGSLGRAGNAAVGNGAARSWPLWDVQRESQIGLIVVAPSRNGALRFEPAFPIPTL